MEPLALAFCVRFVPLCGHPACSPDWRMPRIHGGRFSAVLLARAGLVRTRGRGRLPHRPAPSLRGYDGGGDRVRVARRRVEDWHGAVVSDAARGSGRCASGGVMPQGFPGIPSQGLDLVSRPCTCREHVMYLSWLASPIRGSGSGLACRARTSPANKIFFSSFGSGSGPVFR